MSVYATLLIFHSYYRWFVVLLLLTQMIWLAYHSYRHSVFLQSHLWILLLCAALYDIQFITGWILYFHSTIAQQFWVDPPAMVKLREIRFFGIEHMSMMSLAVVLVNIFTWRSRKRIGQKKVFLRLLKWYILVL
ncbi:MAG TPA: hypothetical protein PKA53_13780, partial [Sphingobacterium sp.]|nr:hypothetical protein [Sphingobacterium sp.]